MANHVAKAKNKSITVSKKKLVPASICAQKAWAGFSPKLKKELRKSLPDTDKDKVPDGFDCRPKNRRRQESFLPVDAAFLSSSPQISLGKRLSEGGSGEVFEVKGNRNLVVKVPRGFSGTDNDSKSTRTWRLGYTQDALKEELEHYSSFSLEKEPLFIPTKLVNLGKGDLDVGDVIGLVRPKVAPIFDYTCNVPERNMRRLTNSQLEVIRRKLINLSHKGYMIKDGLQIGFDKAGRPLLYDFGGMEKHEPESEEVFERNDAEWRSFLVHVRSDYFKSDYRAGRLSKYGTINKDEHY